MKTTAMPWPLSFFITLKSCAVSCAVKLDVGSSRIRTFALDTTSALAMAAIC